MHILHTQKLKDSICVKLFKLIEKNGCYLILIINITKKKQISGNQNKISRNRRQKKRKVRSV